MKNFTSRTFALFLLLTSASFAQLQDVKYGFSMPPKSTPQKPLRILLAFCEEGNQGTVPADANTYLDNFIPANATFPYNGFQGYLSKYFNEASFGQMILLGDYFSTTIHVNHYMQDMLPDLVVASNFDKAQEAMQEIQNRLANQGLGALHNSSNLSFSDFDNYTCVPNTSNIYSNINYGTNKDLGSNNRFDLIVMIELGGNAGLACLSSNGGVSYVDSSFTHIDQSVSPPVSTTINGFENYCYFSANGGIGGQAFIISEAFHALFGPNNWHNGDGAGPHTFMTRTNPYGICTQVAGAGISNVVCGYDRQHFEWKGWADKNKTTQKTYVTSAIDATTLLELNTDGLTVASEKTYILRDFVNYGDALQLKLPHINWQTNGDVKNQYLWIENHQMQSQFDVSTKNIINGGCGQDIAPGIYAQVQVGKDQKTGYSREIFDYGRNENASFLYPLTAKGNYDLATGTPQSFNLQWIVCANNQGTTNTWGPNGEHWEFIPLLNNQPNKNPLTGFSELYSISDLSHDNALNWGEGEVGLLSVNPTTGANEFTKRRFGNPDIAFTCGGTCGVNGKKILGISTNPSTTPIYTLNQNIDTVYYPYENRTIHLNGISITILEENFEPQNYGNGAVKIKIKWDDYNIDKDTRWCAEDIKLYSHDFNASLPSLVIKNGKKLTLDRSKSATRRKKTLEYQETPTSALQQLFNMATIMTALPNSKIKMESNSVLEILNGSTLRLKAGSELKMDANATIYVRSRSVLELEGGSYLEIAANANVIVEDGAKLIVRNGAQINVLTNGILTVGANGAWGVGELVLEDPSLGSGIKLGSANDGPNNTTELRVGGKLTFANGVNFTYNGSGYYVFTTGCSLNFSSQNAIIDLTGKSILHKIWKIDNVYLNTQGHNLKLNTGKILFENGTSGIIANSCDVDFHGLNLESSAPVISNNPLYYSPVNAVLSNNPKSFNFDNVTSTGVFKDIINIPSLSNQTIITVSNSVLKNAERAIFVNTPYNVNVYNSNISNNKNALVITGASRLYLSNSTVNLNWENGILLNSVKGAYFNNDIISQNITGINGKDAIVFLRLCTSINNNGTGIKLIGRKDGSPSHYTSMLTIGDKGSVDVTNNYISAISGEDFLLNIDAYTNAAKTNNKHAFPSSFDGNNSIFNICYSYPPLFNIINARYNYWGNATSIASGDDIEPSLKNIITGYSCSFGQHFDVPLNTIPYSTCIPNNCMDCSDDISIEIKNPVLDIFGNPKQIANVTTYEEVRDLIEYEYTTSFAEFVNVDNDNTRGLFYYIASIDLYYDPSINGWRDVDNNYYNERLVQLVNASKVLINGTPTSRRVKPVYQLKNSKNVVSNLQGLPIALYPNPAKDKLTVSGLRNNLNYTIIINDLIGNIVYEAQKTTDNSIIDISNLATGIYTISIFDGNTKTKLKVVKE